MKRKNDDDLFEDLGFEDFPDANIDDNDESLTNDDFAEEANEDPDELERRRLDYARLRKTDKIFNNSYNTGQPLTEDDEDTRSNSQIKLDSSSAEYHLYDKEKYSDHLDNRITQFDIDSYIMKSKEIQAILSSEPDKKKFAKSEINELFQLIIKGVSQGDDSSVFVSSIHVLDAISGLTNMEYKKLFDMLAYENKETLLLELNKKYKFLDKPSRNLKMF